MTILKMNVDLEEVIDKIINETKKGKKDILKRIEMKKNDLGGLITDEGAACIVAKELGVEIFEPVTYKRKKTQIKDLTIGMNAVSITGRIVSILPIHEYTTKKGQKGAFVKFILQDTSDQIQIIVWNEKIQIFSENKIKENDIVEIKNCYVKEGLNNQIELHLGRQGIITPNPKEVDPSEFANLPQMNSALKINDLKESMRSVNLIGRIQWKSQISTFEKETGTGRVASLGINDETGTIRVALWGDHAPFVDQVEINDIIHIWNGYTRQTQDNSIELHVGNGSRIQKDASGIIESQDSTVPSTPRNIAEVKIKDLMNQRKNVKVTGKIIKKDAPREVLFKSDNSPHQVCDATIADETGCISLSIWDEDILKVQEDKIYCIENGYISTFRGSMKLNAGKFGKITQVDTILTEVNCENNISDQQVEATRKRLSDVMATDNVEILGTIVSIPEQNPFYDSCPICSKKVTSQDRTWSCKHCGTVEAPIPRMLWSFILDDGTSNIRVTVVDKVAEKLLNMTSDEAKQLTEETLSEQYPLISQSKELLGKRILVSGTIRHNSYTSKLQLMANDISFPDPREELSTLLSHVENYV